MDTMKAIQPSPRAIVSAENSIRQDWITHQAKVVLAAYRRDDFADAEGFVVQLGVVLERYADAVISEVTSPLTGIQRQCKFPPSIAEVVEFCNECLRRSNYASEWEKRSRQQVEERARIEREQAREPLEYRKQVAKRILAEFHTPSAKQERPTFRRFTSEELQKIYRRPEPAEAAE
jgi:hypothetical protein